MDVSQVLIVLVFFSACQCSPIGDDLENRVVNALSSVLGFISENVDEMNLDGLFGVVLAKAHLLKLCAAEKKHLLLSNQTSEILSQIRWEHKNLSRSYTTFKKFLFDVKVWKKDVEFTRGIVGAVTPPFQIHTCDQYLGIISNAWFPEKFSDKCLTEIINGSRKKRSRCFLDRSCLEYVTASKCMLGYGITHKILLLQVAKALGCKWNTNPPIINYCSHILWEVRQNANCGFIGQLDDLFLEQVLLCGSEGFLEFFEVRWVEHVLSLQSRFGCFGILENEGVVVRKKREANAIKFGCTDHTTGLAAAALSLFLRILRCSV
ncbi:hypothetical protein PPYR_00635 [Photinus pyralis]|uniref:Uncharacterized protein n=1 Tax=Photinus pyralis TaxID=7054 RepID=A0A5N4B251_PHOPY|nr:UPF0764 protein C16orf89 homolog [Photinus pyralis]XP_031352484.1 UPF0764 protein C16orf89 homolog [Photinus pyralis]KAB0795055.1 hypothetical protein PPYR_11894 [Photinus pyralis]KAB0803665.1 hypothetical protein PPYR_00635 [Photinus pyralis]